MQQIRSIKVQYIHLLKKYFFIIFLSLPVFCFAQNKTANQEDAVLMISDEMPSFPGGEKEMFKFLNSNLKYPQKEKEANIAGKCYVTFVVEKDGSITGTRVLKGVNKGPGFNTEALRVIALMPKWNPGKENGQLARVQFNLPVQFTLQVNDSIYYSRDTTYFNTDWTRGSKTTAEFYRTICKKADTFLVTDRYLKNHLPFMIASCSEVEPLEKNGLCTFYYENGQKKREGYYAKTKNEPGLKWEKNEPAKYWYREDGNWTDWYKNGLKSKQGNYKGGKQEGMWTEWYDNGQKESEGEYKDDKRNGTWIFWDKDGKDSTVVNCFPDGTYKNTHLSVKQQTVNTKFNASYPITVGAEFPGGEGEMAKFIASRVIYPKAERDNQISGTCYVTFIVEQNGSLSGIKVLKDIPNGNGYSMETIRIIRSMPKWKPGMLFGKIVKMQYNLPMRFILR